jgi:hypothetical protein
MRRIYFLIPSIEATRQIVQDLLHNGVEEKHIHVVAKEGTALDDLPEATLAQKSDLIPSIERGVAAGGLVGLLAGVAAVTFPPAGLVLGGGALLGITVFGAGFGAWMSSMVGISIPSGRLDRFTKAIEQGELLLLLDVPKERVDAVEATVKHHHPEADLQGVEASVPLTP